MRWGVILIAVVGRDFDEETIIWWIYLLWDNFDATELR